MPYSGEGVKSPSPLACVVLASASTQPRQEGGTCPLKLCSSGSSSPLDQAKSDVLACHGEGIACKPTLSSCC